MARELEPLNQQSTRRAEASIDEWCDAWLHAKASSNQKQKPGAEDRRHANNGYWNVMKTCETANIRYTFCDAAAHVAFADLDHRPRNAKKKIACSNNSKIMLAWTVYVPNSGYWIAFWSVERCSKSKCGNRSKNEPQHDLCDKRNWSASPYHRLPSPIP